jgi:hypothetical protein
MKWIPLFALLIINLVSCQSTAQMGYKNAPIAQLSKIQKENISCMKYPLNRSIHGIKFSNYIKQGASCFILPRNCLLLHFIYT